MRGDWASRRCRSLRAVAPQLRLGVGYEFLERQDGYEGLVRTYGLQFAESPRVMDLGLLYRALENKSVDVVAGNNTDGLIAAMGLVVLEDDRHYFPPYDAVPIVRPALFAKCGQARSVFGSSCRPHHCGPDACDELCGRCAEAGCCGRRARVSGAIFSKAMSQTTRCPLTGWTLSAWLE